MAYMEDADTEELDPLAMGRMLLEGPLHVPPMSKLEGDPRWATVDVEHLDGKATRERCQEGGHAGLQRLLVRIVDAVLRRQLRLQERVFGGDPSLHTVSFSPSPYMNDREMPELILH
uniref:Uncharacterized protein n=1 Tax=Oryza meridionalis TaxID=40149 RepID=A0A0E0BZY7_9ORYZ